MKYIKKIEKKRSGRLKFFFLFFLLLTIVSFWYNLKYSGKKKNEFPDLTFSEKLATPTTATLSGWYEKSINVILSSTAPNTKIYYTLDGSEPSLSSAIYDKPFEIADITDKRNYLSAIPTSPRWMPPLGNVFKGTILRAISVDAKNYKSDELKRSFYVLNEKQKYSLPVISIVINQKDFFGYNKGIYVLGKTYLDKDNYIRKQLPLNLPWWDYPANYMERGSDAERDAFIEFFEPSGKLGFQSNVGIRINGNATRGFAQKSLRICYRSKYGQASLNYDLFPSNSVKKFNSFILRNGGNDGNKTMFRDALMQSIMKNSHVEIQDNRQSVVFVNGEYWGIHNIRERFDENYLANKYALSPDSVSILELNAALIYGDKSEQNGFADLLDYVKKNELDKDVNYKYVKQRIDIASFQDFVIANVYFCNSDWPSNNVKYWRYTNGKQEDSLNPKDGRWRWLLFDTDWGFGYNAAGAAESDLLLRATKIGSVGVLFGKLIKNEEFKTQFLDRFQYLLNTNFETNQVLEKITEFETILSPEMQEHINRWRMISSKAQWQSEVAVMEDFARKRPQYQADQLNAFFKLQGSKQIRIKSTPKAH